MIMPIATPKKKQQRGRKEASPTLGQALLPRESDLSIRQRGTSEGRREGNPAASCRKTGGLLILRSRSKEVEEVVMEWGKGAERGL